MNCPAGQRLAAGFLGPPRMRRLKIRKGCDVLPTRSQLALRNLVTSLMLQTLLFISGMLLPHFFLLVYGSTVNGMVTSVSNIISYMALVEAGITSSAAVALYRPLLQQDTEARNRALSAAASFYTRSGLIYALLLTVMVAVYPVLVESQLDSSLTRWMIVVLAAGNLFNYLLIGKYRVLATADQKLYICNLYRCLEVIGTMTVTLLLIRIRANAALVKAAGAFFGIGSGLLVVLYVRRHYAGLDFRRPFAKDTLSQRWSALAHQVAGVVTGSIGTVLVTAFTGARSLVETSIYGVYELVAWGLRSIITTFANGIVSGFGQLFAMDDQRLIRRAASNFEYLYQLIAFVCYGCMGYLILPFVALYTAGADVDYVRPAVGLLFTAVGFLQSIRQPGIVLINAAGHFRQTRRRAVIEAAIVALLSLALVRPLGMIGVLLGSLAGAVYRTADVLIYVERHLVPGMLTTTLLRLLRGLAAAGVGLWLVSLTGLSAAGSWFNWFGTAVVTALLLGLTVGGAAFLTEPDEMKQLFGRLKEVLHRRKSGRS